MLALWMLSFVFSANPALCQDSELEPIDAPLPDAVRAPFAQFLRNLGADDPELLIEKARGRSILSVWHSPSFLVRIEDTQLCSEDLCLTVIGHVVEGEFRSDAMFSAGNQFTASDQSVQLFGFQTVPRWLVGDKMTMTLLETPKGWILVTHESEKTSAISN
jgi:hypothetical protein